MAIGFPCRRWSFTVRTLFVLTMLFAAGLGWIALETHAPFTVVGGHSRELPLAAALAGV
jgi:hypothetical protein